jgi:hypothetical protein
MTTMLNNLRTAKDRLRALVKGRRGYRGIAVTTDDNGDPLVRIDVEAGTKQAIYHDIPSMLQGVNVAINYVSGHIQTHEVDKRSVG